MAKKKQGAVSDVLLVADSDSLGLFAVPDLTPVARQSGKSVGGKGLGAAGASPDGKLVAICVGDGRVNVFDAEDLEKVDRRAGTD